MLSGATDLEKRRSREPLGSRCAGSGAALAPELPAGRARVGAASYEGRAVRGALRAAAPRRRSTSCCPRPTATPARPEPEPRRARRARRARAGGGAGPRRAAGRRLSYSGLERYGAAATASTSSGRCACRGRGDAPRARARRARRAARARCAARWCTSCSSGSTSRARGARRRGGRALLESHGEPVRDARGRRPARHGRALRGSRAARPARRGRAGCGRSCRSSSRSRPRGGGACSSTASWTCTPRRTGRHADRRLQDRPLERARRRREIAERDYATQRLVYALAALRSGAPSGSRSPTVPRAARTSRSRRSSRPADAARARAPSCSSWRAGVIEGRFEPTDEPHRELCADCPGRRRCAPGARSARWRPPEPA